MRTKSVLLTLLAILFMNLHAAAQDPIKQGHNGKRILVAYFSATGTTAEAAKKLARVTGGELYAITPANLIRMPILTGITNNRAARWR